MKKFFNDILTQIQEFDIINFLVHNKYRLLTIILLIYLYFNMTISFTFEIRLNNVSIIRGDEIIGQTESISENVLDLPKTFFSLNKDDNKLQLHKPSEVVIKDDLINIYCLRFQATAMQEFKKFSIPASITLGQGILESNVGQSTLANIYNNHFGIKYFGPRGLKWQSYKHYKTGDIVMFKTNNDRNKIYECLEHHKSNSSFKSAPWKLIAVNYCDDSCDDFFKVFQSAWFSYREHSKVLQKNRYQNIYKKCKADLKCWCHSLESSGYATDKQYGEKLWSVIQKHNLESYDLM